MNKKQWVLYMHITPDGKRYIGITCQNPKWRWGNGERYSFNQYFSDAIKRFGWDAIEHIIVSSCLSRSEAREEEVRLIRYYDTTNREKGYNISPGADIVTPEMSARRSKARMGHEVSAETRKKIAEAQKGKIISDETRRKMSKAQKGRKHSAEENRKHSVAMTEYLRSINGSEKRRAWNDAVSKSKEKKVDVYILGGDHVATFNSITEACAFTGVLPPNASKVLKGIRKHSKGYIFKYQEG